MIRRPLFDEDWLPEDEDDQGSYSADYDFYLDYDAEFEEDFVESED